MRFHGIKSSMVLTALLICIGMYNCVQFNYTTEHCIDQSVTYNCSITGASGIQVLTWKIYYDNGTQFGSAVAYTSNVIQAPDTIGGVFTVEQLSQSPLISNISFTVQSSINGYTIVCEDGTFKSKTLQIQVPDDNPGDVTIHTDTFTNSSVNISWTESPLYCNTTYRYNVSSTAPGWVNIIMESTSNSVTVEGLVPSDDQYCVVVTAIDQYSIRDSEKFCFIFNVPKGVEGLLSYFAGGPNTTIFATVQWMTFALNCSNYASAIEPKLIGYKVQIVASLTDLIMESGLLAPHTTDYIFYGLSTAAISYTISVAAVNGIGETRTLINNSFSGCSCPVVPVPSPCVSMEGYSPVLTTNITNSYTTTSSMDNSCATNLPSSSSAKVAGISVAITVPVTAVITAIITVIILYLCGYRRLNTKHSSTIISSPSRNLSVKHSRGKLPSPPSSTQRTTSFGSTTTPTTHSGGITPTARPKETTPIPRVSRKLSAVSLDYKSPKYMQAMKTAIYDSVQYNYDENHESSVGDSNDGGSSINLPVVPATTSTVIYDGPISADEGHPVTTDNGTPLSTNKTYTTRI